MSKSSFLTHLGLIWALLLVCCANTNQDPDPDAISCNEAHNVAICTSSPLTAGKYCCPTRLESHEGCTMVGGTMNSTASCSCDRTHQGEWEERDDEHGCAYLLPVEVDMDMRPDMTKDMHTPKDMSAETTDTGPSSISCAQGTHTCEVSPLTPGKYCCPRTGPSCDCPFVGGSASGPLGFCARICDAAPVGWSTRVDENGCVVDLPGPESCLSAPEDMGADMTASDMSSDADM